QLEQTTVTFPVKVFLYATADEMQPAIVPGGGRGVTVLGEVVYSDTAMVSADRSTLDITRHEVAHIVTREATKGPFGIPGWMNEGISVFAQDRPLAGHQAALQSAIDGDRVLSMPELNSSSTGGSAGTVGVYYGQAGSIISYLVQTYGGEKFAELLRTFKEGSRVDDAFEKTYGFDQAGLENEWRAFVGLPPRAAQPTATPEPEEARGDATPAPSNNGDSASSDSDGGGDDGGNAIAYAIIGVLGVLALGTVVYSARVIHSRL
ncbi:MAG TPA: peptidase MA family metallohydrolase, partial [Dehalococcoidia bacterium]|nr:peptidase MA family metallohydrolase [Dehalococcoidia bacterium]